MEPRGAHRERERERATEDGRSGIVRSGPGRDHYRPDSLRQTAADHPQSAVLGESGFLRYYCCLRVDVYMDVCVVVVGVLSLLSLLRETRDVFSLQI